MTSGWEEDREDIMLHVWRCGFEHDFFGHLNVLYFEAPVADRWVHCTTTSSAVDKCHTQQHERSLTHNARRNINYH